MTIKKTALSIGVLMLMLGGGENVRNASAENLVMTVQVVNRTSRERESMIIRYPLPEELKREDIIETGGLQVRFDEKENALFLFEQIAMAPNESKDYQIIVHDVWQIPKDEFESLKSQIQDRVDFLEGTDDHETAKKFQGTLNEKLARIQKRLDESAGGEILSRIETYRIATKEIEQIREQSTVEGDFVRHARWHAEGAAQEDKGVIRFVITTRNPLSDKPLEGAKIKRYLPRGVEAKHVLEAEGFEIRFDPGDELFYLYRVIDLAPGETQESTITIQNVWHIPDRKIESIHHKARELNTALAGTQYESTGARIMAQIDKHVATIKELQAQTEDSPVDMISNFSLNLKRYQAIEDGTAKLRELVNEVNHPVPQVVPYYIKPATPDISTTWKFIYITIGLLTVFGALFFILWWGQSKSRMNKEYRSYDGK